MTQYNDISKASTTLPWKTETTPLTWKNSTPTDNLLSKVSQDTYQHQSLKYPSNLGNDPTQGHYILININATKGTKVEKDTREVTSNELFGTPTRPLKETNRQDSAYGRLYGVGNMTRRIATSISLYMPANITTTYSTKWENDTLTTPMLAQGGYDALTEAYEVFSSQSLNDMFSGAMANGSLNTTNVMNKVLNKGSEVIQSGLAGMSFLGDDTPDFQNWISLAKRRFRNPYMEFLFRGVNARSFELQFKFLPKTQEEVATVKDIIYQLKYHALPEVTSVGSSFGAFYLYPSEFELTFFSNSTENKYLHKMSTCALTDVSVNYAPRGEFSAFREDFQGSAPTEIDMVLSFTELELLTRDRVEEFGF